MGPGQPTGFMKFDNKLVAACMLFAAPLFSVVYPTISTTISIGFALLAFPLWLRREQSPVSVRAVLGWRGRQVLSALFFYAMVLLVTNLLHGERWGAYHVVLAIVLLVPGWRYLAHSQVQLDWLWRGAAAGALLSFAVALYQVFVLNIERAGEHINPIPFGNISLLLSAAALAGIHMLNGQPRRRSSLFLYFAGALAGVGASLLSGTKGSWLAVAVVIFVAYRATGASVARWKLNVAGLAFLGLLVTMALRPEVSVVPRLKDTADAVQRWLATGDASNDSFGHRMQMWQFGGTVASEQMLIGFGKEGMIERKWQAIQTGQFDTAIGKYVTLHNEFLNMWVTKGALGTIALLWVYGSALMLFVSLREHPLPSVRSLSTAGTALIVLYILFGLWEVAFQLNSYRNVFLFWVVSLLGLLVRELASVARPSVTPSPL